MREFKIIYEDEVRVQANSINDALYLFKKDKPKSNIVDIKEI